MNDSKLGIACIVNTSNLLTGLITDGDLRRTLLKIKNHYHHIIRLCC